MTTTDVSPLTAAMSTLSIYDSMTARKQLFEPQQAGHVGMYVCGMTVYDYCHIGHARVMVAFDMVVRWLRTLGFVVNYVRNITDIDDKIIQRALENNEPISELTARFIIAMHHDADALGCLRPDAEPRATDHIDDMQQLIGKLVAGNHAYQADNGDVYYAVDSFADYGKLSKRNLDDMQAGSRVDVDGSKHNPFDFVLWKAAKPDEPQWASPWGQGRPGWHIECSAMSHKCLGHGFDIHGGGHDLQFPHHENEIAQSEAASGCTYAHHWMHVGFINVDGEKMSKSLGNFFTIRDVVAKYHPETVRYFILSSHYRSQVNFSDAALDEAHTALSRLYQALKSAEQYLQQPIELASTAADNAAALIPKAKIKISRKTSEDSTSSTASEFDNEILFFGNGISCEQVYASTAGQAFIKAMNDDFNTPAAISVLFALVKDINRAITAMRGDEVRQLASILKTLAASINLLQLAAVDFLQAVVGEADTQRIGDDEIEALIAERQQAKADKNYAQADAIRQQLKEQGIELEDSRQGTSWRRTAL